MSMEAERKVEIDEDGNVIVHLGGGRKMVRLDGFTLTWTEEAATQMLRSALRLFGPPPGFEVKGETN